MLRKQVEAGCCYRVRGDGLSYTVGYTYSGQTYVTGADADADAGKYAGTRTTRGRVRNCAQAAAYVFVLPVLLLNSFAFSSAAKPARNASE